MNDDEHLPILFNEVINKTKEVVSAFNDMAGAIMADLRKIAEAGESGAS